MDGYQPQGFYLLHRIGLLMASLMLGLIVLELVRRGRLKERYALLWLGTAGGTLLLGIFPDFIAYASRLLHFQYLTFVFAVSFLFMLTLVLSFSVVLSRQAERTRELAQEVALLEQRVASLEREKTGAASD